VGSLTAFWVCSLKLADNCLSCRWWRLGHICVYNCHTCSLVLLNSITVHWVVWVSKFMLAVCVFAILPELTEASGFLKQLAFDCFVVAIRKLIVELLLQAYFGNVMIRERLAFISELVLTVREMASRPTRASETFHEACANVRFELHV
jgi:hypothetical protein